MKNKGVIVTIKYQDNLILKMGSFDLITVDNSPPNPNHGFAKAVNIGIKQALEKKADIVVLVNPDIKITVAQINRLAQNKADIVSPVLTFTRTGKTIKDYGGKINLMTGRTSHWENTQGPIEYVSGACMVIKKEVFEKIGYFDERYFMYFEDVDFCLRAKKAGFTMAVDKSVVIEHYLEIVKKTKNWNKIKYNLIANFHFITKNVPWYFKPTAYGYLALLCLKIIFNLF